MIELGTQTSIPSPEKQPKPTLKIENLPSSISRFTLNIEDLAKEEEDRHDLINSIPIVEPQFSMKAQRLVRSAVFMGFIGLLIGGRFLNANFSNLTCAQDRVLNALEGANNFINKEGNEYYRNFYQMLCSALVDLTFIMTFGYWVTFSKTSRLPISLALFYGVRALIQGLWYSPFPEGNYWYSPGVPSLVVPYGRGSDFFFSGHTGFMLICALEWHKNRIRFMRNLVLVAGCYTVLILLVYRIHYSIDCFVAVIFADWSFWKIDKHRHHIDVWWVRNAGRIKKCFAKLTGEDKRMLINQ